MTCLLVTMAPVDDKTRAVEGELVWVTPSEYDEALRELDVLEEYFGDGVCPPTV